MLSRVIAKNVGDVFLRHSVYIILRNQATSFDGVIPSGSLPLYF